MYGIPPQTWENHFSPGGTAVTVTPVPPSDCIGSTDSRVQTVTQECYFIFSDL